MLELFKRLVLIQSNCLEYFLQLRLTEKNGQKPFDTPFQLTRLFIRAIIWVFSGFYKELYLTQNDKERIFLCQCVDHLADSLDILTIHFMTNLTYLSSQRTSQLNKLMRVQESSLSVILSPGSLTSSTTRGSTGIDLYSRNRIILHSRHQSSWPTNQCCIWRTLCTRQRYFERCPGWGSS